MHAQGSLERQLQEIAGESAQGQRKEGTQGQTQAGTAVLGVLLYVCSLMWGGFWGLAAVAVVHLGGAVLSFAAGLHQSPVYYVDGAGSHCRYPLYHAGAHTHYDGDVIIRCEESGYPGKIGFQKMAAVRLVFHFLTGYTFYKVRNCLIRGV